MKFTDIFVNRPVLASVISLLIFLIGLRAIGIMVSTYDLVCEINNHPEIFSSKFARQLGNVDGSAERDAEESRTVGFPPMDTLLTADPPEHTRYRKLVNKTFSPKRVSEMESDIERISNELIDTFIDKGEVEFSSEYAQLLPLTVIAGQLGVPMADHAGPKDPQLP